MKTILLLSILFATCNVLAKPVNLGCVNADGKPFTAAVDEASSTMVLESGGTPVKMPAMFTPTKVFYVYQAAGITVTRTLDRSTLLMTMSINGEPDVSPPAVCKLIVVPTAKF